MAHPVEAEHALRPLDAATEEHDVVATFGVEVLLTAVAVEDVVSGFIGIVPERGAVVTLQQVERPEPAFDPVVATVAEDGVLGVPGEDEVVAFAGERLGDVVATDDEVVAAATLVEVTAEALARRQIVVAVTALQDVVAEQVGEEVVTETADEIVDTVAALEAIVAAVAASVSSPSLDRIRSFGDCSRRPDR